MTRDHLDEGDVDARDKLRRRWLYGALTLVFTAAALAALGLYFFLAARNGTAACWGAVGCTVSLLLAADLLQRRRGLAEGVQPTTAHVKALFIVGIVAALGGMQGIVLNGILSVRSGPSAFTTSGDAVALFMAMGVFVLGLVTVTSCYGLVKFDRQENQVYLVYVSYYSLVAIVAVASAVLLLVLLNLVEAAVYCGVTAVLAATVAAESRYRHLCFFSNRPSHDHLRLLALAGATAVLTGLGLVPYHAFQGILWADNQPAAQTFVCSPFMAFLAALWMERWGVTLCWTAWYFRSTEDGGHLFERVGVNDDGEADA